LGTLIRHLPLTIHLLLGMLGFQTDWLRICSLPTSINSIHKNLASAFHPLMQKQIVTQHHLKCEAVFKKIDTSSLKFLETKNWSIAVWAACVKKNKKIPISFWTSELHISQAFQEHQACQFQLHMNQW
jgi:hypothetical protein